ncbi:MAG: PaaI family thioesterase, partial [Methylocystaceae bacterium]
LHLKQLARLINESPYFQLLSMAIEDMGIGYSLVKISLEPKHLSPYGAIQGGVYSSLIDTAAYWAPYAELDEKVGLISMDVNVHNLASVKGGTIIARGERIKIGRTTCLSQVLVTDENDRVLAQGSSKLLITQGLQTIPQMVGFSPERIPSKFLD